MRKKKGVGKHGMGYCIIYFFSLSHNTENCIVTGKAGRQRLRARRGAPRHGAAGHDTATARPRYGNRPAIRPGSLRYDRVCAHDTASSARGWEPGMIQRFLSWLRG